MRGRRQAYKRRNLIERCVNALKQFRRIATRYEKTARAFLSMLCIGAARLWIKTVNTGLVSFGFSLLLQSQNMRS
ncbi:MAG: transposase [Hyphomicrobiales bacterium]|nr:transposase [Hyphomicrobiales bacterium]